MDAATHKIEVGQRLLLAIEAMNMSQRAVARDFNENPSKLGNWVRGLNYPDPWFIYQFCDRYGVTADWIYRGLLSAGMAKPVADALWEAGRALRAE